MSFPTKKNGAKINFLLISKDTAQLNDHSKQSWLKRWQNNQSNVLKKPRHIHISCGQKSISLIDHNFKTFSKLQFLLMANIKFKNPDIISHFKFTEKEALIYKSTRLINPYSKPFS